MQVAPQFQQFAQVAQVAQVRRHLEMVAAIPSGVSGQYVEIECPRSFVVSPFLPKKLLQAAEPRAGRVGDRAGAPVVPDCR